MKRYGTLMLIGLAVPAWAQVVSRESYRGPQQAWRQAAPALEQEAAVPGAQFMEQLRVSAEAAQVFFNARAAYFPSAQPDAAAQLSWAAKPLATGETLLSTPLNVEQLLAVRAAKVSSEMGAFKADDKDAAIRRVRQAIDREYAALRALTATLSARKGPLMELIDRTDDAEIQRASAYQALNSASARRTQLGEHVKREATDWAAYYKNLLEGATGSRTQNTAGASQPGAAPAKIIRPAANGQIPITRYTGEWIFPNKGLFYGSQPESVELVIQENNGRMTGTLSARFVNPAGTLKFDFQGPVVTTAKTQTFPLSGGEMGSIELIPGSAFNLLEVNFQTASQVGNFVLVKR